MKKIFVIFNICLFAVSLYAEDRLPESEVQKIISNLTGKNQSTWINYGTIAARHRVKNEEMNETCTLETIRYDGSRFSWEIAPDDSIKDIRKKRNINADNQEENQHRIFVWDGQRYTMYFKSLNHALYFDDSSEMPVVVNGPLTAGLIPWGRGIFTNEKLSAADISAFKVKKANEDYVALKIQLRDQFKMEFLLDCSVIPYTVMVYSMEIKESKTVQTYGDYLLTGKTKVPRIIIIEKYGPSNHPVSEEVWEMLHVSQSINVPDPFAISPEEETLVEFVSGKDKSLFGRYSKKTDLEMLYEEKVTFDWAKGRRIKNCGIRSAMYILGQYGIFPEKEFKSLHKPVNQGQSESVSLYEIKGYMEKNGLHCQAVRTDVEGLRQMSEFQIILYFPFIKHFVVLDRIEEDKVWMIDLSRNKFYDSMCIKEFARQWHGGVAMVASDRQIESREHVRSFINDSQQKQIYGNGAYVCTEIIQPYKIVNCSPLLPSGECDSYYQRFRERYGCVHDPNDTGQGCSGIGMLGSIYSECKLDESNQSECVLKGNFMSRDIRACTN